MAAIVIRLLLTVLLIVFVYQETGIWTATAIGLISVAVEVMQSNLEVLNKIAERKP